VIAKILGILLLIVGGCIAAGILVALVGTILGMLWFTLKLAIPCIIIYIGYRLLTRERNQVAY